MPRKIACFRPLRFGPYLAYMQVSAELLIGAHTLRLVTLAVLASFLSAGSLVAAADSIPYGNIGTVVPQHYFTAIATGNVTGYFYSADAADTDFVRMVDTTTNTASDWYFDNHTTAVGTTANFGAVNAGDNLVFELFNTDGNFTFASDPAYSDDGINHAYSTSFTAATINGVDFPNGIYLGMEDLYDWDFNYNNDNFVVTNVQASPVPEPGSLLLLGTGALGAIGAIRRKLFN